MSRSAKKPKITVAIPTLGREGVLIDSINDVFAQTETEFEIIVADQTASHEQATIDFFKKCKDKRLRYFQLAPASLPAARNFCLSKARADIILFIDDDVRLPNDFIAEHLRVYRELKDVSVVAGRVKQKGVPFTHELVHFDQYGFQRGWYNCPDPQYSQNFPGGNFSAKIAVLKEVGGFDASYMANALREESDCGLRITKAGYKIYFNPKAFIIHLAAPSGGTRIHTHQYNNLEFYKNDLLFTLKIVVPHKIPLALAKKYYGYVWTTYIQKNRQITPILFIMRHVYFCIGLAVAIKRMQFPVQIIQREVHGA